MWTDLSPNKKLGTLTDPDTGNVTALSGRVFITFIRLVGRGSIVPLISLALLISHYVKRQIYMLRIKSKCFLKILGKNPNFKCKVKSVFIKI